MSAVGEVIRERRLILGLSAMELAERADLHRSYVADVYRGARNISVMNLSRLASGLMLSSSELVKMAEQKLPPELFKTKKVTSRARQLTDALVTPVQAYLVALGLIVEDRRKQRGMSLNKLSECLRIDAKQLERLEQGNLSPKFETVIRLAKCLNTGLGELVALVEERTTAAGKLEKRITGHPDLTERELEVLGLVCQGLSNEGIADLLNVSGETVKSHVKNLMQKLGVNSRIKLAVRATTIGILTN